MAGGVNAVQAGADHGDGVAAALQGAFVCGAVNAKREAAGDGNPRLGEGVCELLAGAPRRFGRVAAADDGDLGGGEQTGVAVDVQQRRRVGDLPQQRRIGGVMQRDNVPPVALRQPVQVGIYCGVVEHRLPGGDFVVVYIGQALAYFRRRGMKKRFRRAEGFQKRVVGFVADARRTQERAPGSQVKRHQGRTRLSVS